MGCFFKRQKRSYYCSFKKWLEDNDKEMHSTYNEGKSVVVERFIKTLKIKTKII